MKRREFFKTSLIASTVLLTDSLLASSTKRPFDNQEISKIAFPEKRPLITYSDRPPILESPRESFTRAITPNDEFFVRWHTPKIPTHKYASTYRININGEVNNTLSLSLKDLKTKYEQVEITAVMQCGGNSRSAFSPTPTGIQWGSGAMGCALWKGVRLSDILKSAGLKSGATWIGLNGDDKPILNTMPTFVRELELHEITDDVIVAYEMNGEDLPYLNGYPVRLIIPGYYADSWVKMLSNITVLNEYKELFFMDNAYRIADNECECETPDKRAEKTKPITTMNVKSYIGYPTCRTQIKAGNRVVLKGVAFDEGNGIKEVQISTDEGKTWESADLEKELSLHAFRVFKYAFKPMKKGKFTLMAKAINKLGEAQPFENEIQWNHGGYKYNGIDSVTINVL